MSYPTRAEFWKLPKAQRDAILQSAETPHEVWREYMRDSRPDDDLASDEYKAQQYQARFDAWEKERYRL